jgi:hypothetical protein
MAAATLAKFRTRSFSTSLALHQYVTKDDSPVAEIVSIAYDNHGQFILFYLVA